MARQSFRPLAIIITGAGHTVPVVTNYYLCLVPKVGVEPTRPPRTTDFKSVMSTYSITQAWYPSKDSNLH